MYFFIFLAIFFFGIASSAPTKEDCHQEWRQLDDKCENITLSLPDRDLIGTPEYYQQVPPILDEWLECMGTPVCRYNQVMLENSRLGVTQAVHYSQYLSKCLTIEDFNKFQDECELPLAERVECDDKEEFICVTNKIRHHEGCTWDEVQAFHSTFELYVEYCKVRREFDEFRKPKPRCVSDNKPF